MSKKIKSIKKGLHEAIAHAKGGAPGTRAHLPHRDSLLSQPDYFDESCTQMWFWRAMMSKRKISIEDYKNDKALSLQSRKSKEVARPLDAKAEKLPYTKVFDSYEYEDFLSQLTPKRSIQRRSALIRIGTGKSRSRSK